MRELLAKIELANSAHESRFARSATFIINRRRLTSASYGQSCVWRTVCWVTKSKTSFSSCPSNCVKVSNSTQTAVLACLARIPNDLSCLMIVVVCRIFCNQLSTYSRGIRLGVEAKSSESARRTVANALNREKKITSGIFTSTNLYKAAILSVYEMVFSSLF